MKAILTKVIPATNTRPTRITAYTEGGNSFTASVSSLEQEPDYRQEDTHLRAALCLCEQMEWGTNLIGGGTPDGYCFVFTNSEPRSKPEDVETMKQINAALRLAAGKETNR